MARAYIKIFIGNERIRTYGGNVSDVRRMAHMYKTMTPEEFAQLHPKYKSKAYDNLKIYYYRN